MTSTESKPTAEQEFGAKVSDLLHPYNPQGKSLKRFIQKHLQQWYLNSSDAEDVLHEAILQGLRYTRKTGEKIPNPAPWLRVTSLRILQNRVRQTIRQEKLPEALGLITPATSNDPVDLLELEDLLTQISLSRQTLSEEDQEILTLYFDQEKTYEQIKSYYERKDGQLINLPTIRKRISRAKERAFKAFHELNCSFTPPGYTLGQNSEKLNATRFQ
jgi:DNA-directed RNA polymerase specialized sigma24 family protein